MTDVRTAPYAAEEKRGYRTAKRVFDILLSFPLGILSLIPMGILAAVIVCKDGENPFYGQSRVGQNGQEFRLIKLRSMKKGADRLGDVLDERQLQEYQKEYKLDDDPRLIGWKKPGDGSRCFGAKLRRSSMDELPQILFNVFLTGKMSMVGPRPILRQELEEHYTREDTGRHAPETTLPMKRESGRKWSLPMRRMPGSCGILRYCSRPSKR